MYRTARRVSADDEGDGISLQEGDKVIVLETIRHDERWVKVQPLRRGGRVGVAPRSCLEEEESVRFPLYVARKFVANEDGTEFAAMGEKVEQLHKVSEYGWLVRHVDSRAVSAVDGRDFLPVTDDAIIDGPITDKHLQTHFSNRFVVDRMSIRNGRKSPSGVNCISPGVPENSPAVSRSNVSIRCNDTPEGSPAFIRRGDTKKSLRKRLSIRRDRSKSQADKEERKEILEELDSTISALKGSKNLRQKSDVRDLLVTLQKLRNEVSRGRDLDNARTFLNKNGTKQENGTEAISSKAPLENSISVPIPDASVSYDAASRSESQPLGDLPAPGSVLDDDPPDPYTAVPNEDQNQAPQDGAIEKLDAAGNTNGASSYSACEKPASYASIDGILGSRGEEKTSEAQADDSDTYAIPRKTSKTKKPPKPKVKPPPPPESAPKCGQQSSAAASTTRPVNGSWTATASSTSLPTVKRGQLGKNLSGSSGISSRSSGHIKSPLLARFVSKVMSTGTNPKEVAKRLVEDVRVKTGSSFDNSFVAAKTVLEHMKEFIPDKTSEIEELEEALDQLQSGSTTDGSKDTHDGNRLDVIFAELTTMRNDGQQRNWTVHDDADVITEYLEELLSILSEADQVLCAHKVAYDDYAIVTTLTEYYQMETRVPIRLLLLKFFGGLCSLDTKIPSVLLTSNLPLELARDIKADTAEFQKTLYSCLVGTMMFSSGEKPPFNYYETWNTDFMLFLLDLVENPLEEDEEERLLDCVLGLVLGFNYHFLDIDVANNHVMKALQAMPTTRNFCEKVLLIVNREEDPVALSKPLVPDSVLKLLKDMFAERSTASLFYTSDTHVLIGIVARQLNDLPEDSELRYHYLLLLEEMVQTTDFNTDQYGKEEIATALVRIEEGEVVEARNKDTITRIRSLAPSLAAS
ncbi:NCK-interacting protein with SH3 domain-like [Sycon ciliatum]|uniref:NCK-interacting protein with SH3 domain-like n=1 Tax=Sycon ciliatum TaxID=27933 RepID=UPI0020A95317|eukprot:scpid11898/ scgid35154/ NCK-interacting protein with SH3 domain; 54 kDa VacA-interacting protein; 90 kDa N-WASP-interacting protein; 90 kDa SH3 protein interacting with Nck; SH3 adapter protein SPIN90; WASP-interacting SH3-domain protein; Wiskott-Aldrich syndrome protein-binding protein